MSGSQTTLESQADFRSETLDPSLLHVRDLIYRVCGIYVAEKRLNFLQDRCNRRIQAMKTSALSDYFKMLTAGRDRDAEIRNLLNEITIGDTCFFRGKPQLDALRKVVLPTIVAAKAKLSDKPVKLWSCGCSTGEEPYTLAMLMLLEDAAGRLGGCTWEIHATDLNDHALDKAKAGIYDAYALRHTPALFKSKYFVGHSDKFMISEEVKCRVTFCRINLQDESSLPLLDESSVIFCANVLIYFDETSKRRVVHNLFKNLAPGGYLFLGTSESLYGVSDEFRLVHFPEAIGYLRPSDSLAGASVERP
ncbi:MAG: protein-glutamate O-methyltransferase CheR [Candidatus Acidiferrales bacterium]